MRRELREEIGIIASTAEPYMQVHHSYPDRKILLDVWELIEFSGVARACEQQEITWIDIDQIGQFRFPAADIPILDAIRNSRPKETKRLP